MQQHPMYALMVFKPHDCRHALQLLTPSFIISLPVEDKKKQGVKPLFFYHPALPLLRNLV